MLWSSGEVEDCEDGPGVPGRQHLAVWRVACALSPWRTSWAVCTCPQRSTVLCPPQEPSSAHVPSHRHTCGFVSDDPDSLRSAGQVLCHITLSGAGLVFFS